MLVLLLLFIVCISCVDFSEACSSAWRCDQIIQSILTI